MLDDILNQPASLAAAIAHQTDPGAADLQAAAAVLRRARRIVFAGMGSSLYASIPAACLLRANGTAAEAVDASELLYFGTRALGAETAVVLVSRSGESIEILKLLPLLAGASVVAVSNVPASSLCREANTSVMVNSAPDRTIAVQTYTATVAVLLLLAAEVAGVRVDASPLPAAVSAALDNARQAIEQWKEFLAGAPVVYLLGRGPSLASAFEGSLLFNEASRTPAVAMAAAQFRHGPVEVVDERLRAIVFAAPGNALDEALAADLRRIGGQVRMVSGESVPAPFAPVLEAIPVELAAYAMAERKGIQPGHFRYATQVTSAETGFKL